MTKLALLEARVEALERELARRRSAAKIGSVARTASYARLLAESVRQAVAILDLDHRHWYSGHDLRQAIELTTKQWERVRIAFVAHPNVTFIGDLTGRRYQWRAS